MTREAAEATASAPNSSAPIDSVSSHARANCRMPRGLVGRPSIRRDRRDGGHQGHAVMVAPAAQATSRQRRDGRCPVGNNNSRNIAISPRAGIRPHCGPRRERGGGGERAGVGQGVVAVLDRRDRQGDGESDGAADPAHRVGVAPRGDERADSCEAQEGKRREPRSSASLGRAP